MNRPRPTPKTKLGAQTPGAKFIRRAECRYPMQLLLHYRVPVTLAQSNEDARRLLDGLRTQMLAQGLGDDLEKAEITCGTLRRTLSLVPDPFGAPTPQTDVETGTAPVDSSPEVDPA